MHAYPINRPFIDKPLEITWSKIWPAKIFANKRNDKLTTFITKEITSIINKKGTKALGIPETKKWEKKWFLQYTRLNVADVNHVIKAK